MPLPRKIIVVTFGLFIIFVSLGCSSREMVSDRTKVYYALPEQALAKIRKADDLKGALKTIARIEIRSGEERYPIKAAIIAKSPGSLRIETIPLIGTPDFFMVMNKDYLKVFYPHQELFYTGKATREHLVSFLPVAISPQTIVAFLTGSYPGHLFRDEDASWYGAPDKSLYRLDLLVKGTMRQSCRIDPVGHRLVHMESFDEDGRLSYTVDYGDFKKIGEVDFPQEVIFEACINRLCKNGKIRYYDTELTPHIDDALFDIAVPPGIKIIPLE